MPKIQREYYNQIYLFGTMSSGKSSVINALIGDRILPSSNYACTAKQIEVVINKKIKNKKIYIDKSDGSTEIISNATVKDVEKYNDDKGIELLIESDMEAKIYSDKPLMFIDTPGVNYYGDDTHEEITYETLAKVKDAVIIYVLNASQYGTEDDAEMLRKVAPYAKDNKIIVVLNKADTLYGEREPITDYVEKKIPAYLKKMGIDNYDICPLSADAALLFRRLLKKDFFSETDEDRFGSYYRYFKRWNLGANSKEDDNAISEQQEYIVDGQSFSYSQINKVLHNTGIYELENCISKVLGMPETENKKDSIQEVKDKTQKTKEKREDNMREVYIKYNPYIVKTTFMIDGKPIDKISEFYEKQENVRLQEWIEPNGDWKGFFEELRQYLNSSEEINITFCGTQLDYEDLLYAHEKYGKGFKSVSFTFVKGNNDRNRMEVLKEKFEELKNGPIEELRDERIQEAFERALSGEFEIVVTAPMSSGKSTVINAILGKEVLPAYNEATTATIMRIKDDDTKTDFEVSCKNDKGEWIVKEQPATLKCIDELNKYANENKNVECLDIRGNIPYISSDKVNVVFVDTPGGNNAEDEEHKEVMKRAIHDENKGMILFVFNFTQLGTDDCDAILSLAAQAMQNAKTGKQARDRFIFVCNKMDAQDPEKEPYESCLERIRLHLKKKGIEEPNLFLTCADACKLIRKQAAGEYMTDSEDDRLDAYLKPFNRPIRRLFMYSSISQEMKKKYLERVEAIAETGEKRNEEAAEINSGIPALESAIEQYITKYAQAIKIKTIHDVFMDRVIELDMKAKSETKWSESVSEYEKMRKELLEKEASLAKDQQLQKFKDRVDAIRADYSKVKEIQEKLVEEIMDIPYQYPEKIEKTKAKALLEDCYENLKKKGKKIQQELELSLENCVYKQCKDIIKEYKSYIAELDKSGLLNIGDYNFKKMTGFEELKLEDLEKISSKYVTVRVVSSVKKKKSGFMNALKRAFGSSSGWYWEDVKADFVSLREVIKQNISKLELDVLEETENEIERAKENEERVKKFANENLSGIKAKVEEEIRKIKIATEDRDELKKRADVNRQNMEWLNAFIEEIESLLDV